MADETGEGRERRRHPRYKIPRLVLRIEKQKYRTRDWSLGGFRLNAFHRPVESGEQLQGVATTWTGLFREPFDADVVRSGGEGEVRCKFLERPKALLEALTKAKK